MSVVLERRLTKDQILELYLNDVSLGQRGSFAIHGVAEAARLFFGKDITNVSLAEAATIAGVIQSPSRLSPFNNPERAQGAAQRRAAARWPTPASSAPTTPTGRRASRCRSSARALEAEAPYFVDYVSQELQDEVPQAAGAVDVYTTLDLHLQRIAQDARPRRAHRVDEMLARRKRQRAQAALIAVDPRTGEILALVGGRSYNQSQYNRAIARAPAAGVGVQAVRLPRRVRARAARTAAPTSRRRRSSSTSRRRSTFNEQDVDARATTTASTTARSRCAARSRCRATSPRSRSPKRPATTTSPRSGGGSAPARRRGRTRRSRSACSRRRRSRSPPPTRSSPTAARSGRCARSRGSSAAGKDLPIKTADAAHGRAARHDLPRHQHDAQRDQRGHRRRRARGRLRARRRRQVRHDQRSARRLVRRLHARAADGGLGRPRRQPAARPERHAGGAADLDRVHDARAGRPRQRHVRARPTASTSSTSTATPASSPTPGCPRVFNEAFLAGTEPTEVCPLHSVLSRAQLDSA